MQLFIKRSTFAHYMGLIFAFKWIIVSGISISSHGRTSDAGNSEDVNDLCEFIPLPHILCKQEKINRKCPRLCNSYPTNSLTAWGKYHILFWCLKNSHSQ